MEISFLLTADDYLMFEMWFMHIYARAEKHIYKWANHGYSKIKMQCPPCTFQKYIICQNRLLIMKIYWSSAVCNPITRVKQKPFPDLKLTGTGNIMQFPFSSSYLLTGKDREWARETIWCSSCYCYEFTNAQAARRHILLPAAGFLSVFFILAFVSKSSFQNQRFSTSLDTFF